MGYNAVILALKRDLDFFVDFFAFLFASVKYLSYLCNRNGRDGVFFLVLLLRYGVMVTH